ncbi:GNAT family N-acetyltransferase [Gephyromycinifex aptenodytis]|uniref:GNAT family N-acetyltransferase n=1 Tax=Gephyromycinifex aptenodytis TaxID=2716227 RepID=UPI001448774B|nr:GNAT family N-acetyltransferase [Gephyromycinifex aptenodytis]
MKGLRAQLTRVARAEADDAFALAALELALNREQGRPPEEGFLDRYTDAWLRDRDRYPSWIASSLDGNPLGALTITLGQSLPRPGRIPRPWGHMTNFYVRPEARRMGLGTRLLDEAVEWADSRSLLWITLLPSQSAQSLLQRVGFAPCGEDLLRRTAPAGKRSAGQPQIPPQ